MIEELCSENWIGSLQPLQIPSLGIHYQGVSIHNCWHFSCLHNIEGIVFIKNNLEYGLITCFGCNRSLSETLPTRFVGCKLVSQLPTSWENYEVIWLYSCFFSKVASNLPGKLGDSCLISWKILWCLILLVKLILQKVVGIGKMLIKIKLEIIAVLECIFSSYKSSFLLHS